MLNTLILNFSISICNTLQNHFVRLMLLNKLLEMHLHNLHPAKSFWKFCWIFFFVCFIRASLCHFRAKCPIGCKVAFWSSFPSLGADGLYRKWGMDIEHFERNTSLRVNHIYLQFIAWILRVAETNWGCSDSHLGQHSHSLQHKLRLSVPIFFFLQFIPTKG